jgi:HSP20 family molecular chaperone IbpA
VKSVACARRTNRRQSRPVRKTAGPSRECVALHDLTDCLLEAYDCVARRAYQRFRARGGKGGRELDDWLAAEREVLPELPAQLSQSDRTIYALANLPGATAAQISVGVESQWLVILARPKAAKRRTQAFCVLELPAKVDPARSVAVLSEGLLAIRMPKTANLSGSPS